MKKLWGDDLQKQQHNVDDFGASIHFDQQLVEEDIEGSIAHVTMLGECGILPKEDVTTIKNGLMKLLEKAKQGELSFSVAYEDIHLNIEKMLIDEVGPVGGKLHTGRSRNDQVATDMHLYLRKRVIEIVELIRQLQRVLVKKAEQHIETLVPGYTHLQRAQPISFAHHLMAYVWMFERDRERFTESLKRINKSPLGAGALAGTTFPIDRHLTAQLLGFDSIYENSLDAVSDRDFIIEFLSNSSILMMHLSRFCEDSFFGRAKSFSLLKWMIRLRREAALCHKRKTQIWLSSFVEKQGECTET
ncbi:Argininosuccinate lyase 1 [Anoxybacillus sp. BCO1]|nr:Argininosuccinate lyase 1 [Anoxybacillus sp. BCO1]